ncbi:MAG: squalene/phytoene synthase family protein, partial [Verrucomicrobiaceae bacterium]
GEDARNGRIYLPMEDLKNFHVNEEQILQRRFDSNVEALLQFQHDRAVGYYRAATSVLPREDRPHMQAAEMMAQIYSEILEKIRRKHFRILDVRVRLSKLRKLTIFASFTVRRFFGR